MANRISREILAETKNMDPSQRRKFGKILEKEMSAAVQRSKSQLDRETGDANEPEKT